MQLHNITHKDGRHALDHAVIAVPLRITEAKNAELYFQLDTGAPHSVVYKETLLARGMVPSALSRVKAIRAVPNPAHSTTLILEGVELSWVLAFGKMRRTVFPLADSIPRRFFVGTLGLDFLDGRLLMLDVNRKNLCVLEKRNFAPNTNIQWVDLTRKDERMRVTLSGDSTGQFEAMIDSGAGHSDISTTDYEFFKRLTGVDSLTSTDVYESKSNSWGTQIAVYKALAKSPIHVSSSAFNLAGGERPLVAYVPGAKHGHVVSLQSLARTRAIWLDVQGAKLGYAVGAAK